MASIVDPRLDKGGAGTVTRGLEALLEHCYPASTILTVAPPPVRLPSMRRALCVAGVFVTRMPAKVRFHHQRLFVARLERLLRHERVDLLVVNGTDLAWCLDYAPSDIPRIAVVHNEESQIYRQQLASLPGPWRILASALRHDVNRLAEYEIDGLRRVTGAVFLSKSDAASAASKVPSLRMMVLPPVFRDAPLRIPKRPSNFLELGFLGNLDWWPNRDGLDWFLQEILTSVPSDVHLNVFGNGSERFGARHPRVIGHGYVTDLTRVWERCDWMAVPIRFGSGVAVKTAECIYNGMPVLTTTFGLRGLPDVECSQIVRLESSSDWIRFLCSPQARESCRERLPASHSDPFRVESNATLFSDFVGAG